MQMTDFLTHIKYKKQYLIDAFTSVCSTLGLSINVKKTYMRSNIFVYNHCIGMVDDFVYFSSTLLRKYLLHNEIVTTFQKTFDAFGKLEQ